MTNTGKDTLRISLKASKEQINGLSEIYTDSGVAEWIILDRTEGVLRPGESQNIEFKIQTPSTPGFCDARMVICITATPSSTDVNGQFNMIQGLELYIPLILNVPGPIHENIEVATENPKLVFSFIPTNFNYLLTNNGTVKETVDSVLHLSGVKKYNLNNSTSIMPGDQKHIKLNWTPGIFDIGLYSLNLESTYGDYGTTHHIENNNTVFVIPWHLLLLFIGLASYIFYTKKEKR